MFVILFAYLVVFVFMIGVCFGLVTLVCCLVLLCLRFVDFGLLSGVVLCR